jgi:hypothetical protein
MSFHPADAAAGKILADLHEHLAAVVDMDDRLAAPELRERIAAVIDDYLAAAVRHTINSVFDRDRSAVT